MAATHSTNTSLDGILPALVTPLDDSEAVNAPALEALLARVYEAGAHGVYVCGSTGEGMSLPASERRRVAETAVRCSAGKTVIVHVGAPSQAEAVDLARHASRLGASAVSSLPPIGVSYPEIAEYYRALAAAVDVPVLTYYFPASGGANLTPGQLLDICRIPGIAGLKFTDFDLYTMSLIARHGATVFNGRDEVLCAGLLMGAAGGIGSIYNVAPQWFVELYSCARAGRWADARSRQDRINDLIRVLLAYPLIPAIKCVLSWSGIPCGEAVKPRRALTPTERTQLRASLERLDVAIAV